MYAGGPSMGARPSVDEGVEISSSGNTRTGSVSVEASVYSLMPSSMRMIGWPGVGCV